MIANPNYWNLDVYWTTLLECKKFKLLNFPSFFLILNLCDLYIVIQIYVPLNIDIHLSILSQGGRRYCTVICHLSVHLN